MNKYTKPYHTGITTLHARKKAKNKPPAALQPVQPLMTPYDMSVMFGTLTSSYTSFSKSIFSTLNRNEINSLILLQSRNEFYRIHKST